MKISEKIEHWLFYLLVFFLPLQTRIILRSFRPQFNEWTSIYLYVTDILIISLVIFWLARGFKKTESKGRSKSKKSIEKVLIGFLLISGFSLLAADNFRLGLYSFIKLLEFSVLFLYVKYSFRELFSLSRFWQVFVASASIQSLIAIAQFFKQKSLGLKIFAESPLSPEIVGVAKIVVEGKKIIRAYGLMPHPNILATFLVLALFGLMFLFIKKYGQLNISRKILFSVVFILLSSAFFLTFSRVVQVIGLSLLFGWLILIWRWREFKKPAFIVFLFLISFFLFLIIVFWPYFSARYDLSNINQGQSVGLRFFYSRIAWDFFKGSPIFGIGQGNFIYKICSFSFMQNWMCQPVHNIYFLIAAETGILGLLVFLGFLFVTIWGVFKKRASLGEEDKFAAFHWLFVIGFLLLVGLFDHFFWTLQQGQLMLWILLGILASYAVSPCSSADRALPSGGRDQRFKSSQGRTGIYIV